jgi:hypothetical protein
MEWWSDGPGPILQYSNTPSLQSETLMELEFTKMHGCGND